MKTVVHYKVGPYLPLVETWIHGQIANLKRYRPIVYCHGTQNLHMFPVSFIRSVGRRVDLQGMRGKIRLVWNTAVIFFPCAMFYLNKDRPCLIHAHFGPSGYYILPLKRLFKLPLVTTFYGYDLCALPVQDRKWVRRYKALFQQGDFFLVEGSHMRKSLAGLGCPDEKIVVQHLGIDFGKVRFEPRRLGDDGTLRVLTVASFREKKGIPYALEAIGIIKQDYPEMSVKLTIIGGSNGTPSSENEKAKILQSIEKYGLEKHVNLMGYQPFPVVLEELYKHHIFLSPSVCASDGDAEGGVPVSIIEASASGMPVVSTKHCDIPEVVLNGRSGYLVDERDVQGLVEKLVLLAKNPESWGRMGLSGRNHVENMYDSNVQSGRLEEVYDHLLKKDSEK